MPRFESRTELAASPERVFDYVSRPANLQSIAPPEAQFVYIQPPPVIQLGTRLVCKMQAHGMVQQMAYEIVEFVPTEFYREKMVEGPLRFWMHDCIVEPAPNGSILINQIEFEPPGGLLGLIVGERKILEALEDGFDHRALALKKVFG